MTPHSTSSPALISSPIARIGLGLASFFYLILPNGGLVELVPDPLPIIGNLDEGAASILLIRSLQLMKNYRHNNQISPIVRVVAVSMGILGIVYLLLPTFGVVEFIPDLTPFIGHVDELAAILFSSLAFTVTSPLEKTSMKLKNDDTTYDNRSLENQSALPTVILEKANNGCLLAVGIVTVVVVICAASILFITGTSARNLIASLMGFGFPETQITTEGRDRIIVDAVSATSKLVTTELQLSNLNLRINYRGGVGNALGHGASHAITAEILAGIDLQKPDSVKVNSADIDGKTQYTIILPPPEILNCTLTGLVQYDRSTTVSGNWNDLEEIARYVALSDFVTQIIEDGAIENVKLSAQTAVLQLVKAIYSDIDVTVQFETAESITIDDTCSPRLPNNYVYDEAEGAWKQP